MLQKDNLTKDEQDWIKEYENTDEYEQIYGEDKEVIDVYSETGDDVIRFQYFNNLDELHQNVALSQDGTNLKIQYATATGTAEVILSKSVKDCVRVQDVILSINFRRL